MAEREGFEPPDEDYPSTVFKTAALNRSATSPYYFKTPISKDFQQYLNATYIHIISICV